MLGKSASQKDRLGTPDLGLTEGSSVPPKLVRLIERLRRAIIRNIEAFLQGLIIADTTSNGYIKFKELHKLIRKTCMSLTSQQLCHILRVLGLPATEIGVVYYRRIFQKLKVRRLGLGEGVSKLGVQQL